MTLHNIVGDQIRFTDYFEEVDLDFDIFSCCDYEHFENFMIVRYRPPIVILV